VLTGLLGLRNITPLALGRVGEIEPMNSDIRDRYSPVLYNPYRSWFAGSYACGAADAETPFKDFCHPLAIFFYDPVNPGTLRTYPDTFPASSAFFRVNIYIYHNCNIQRSYINAQTK
jgi:hypothetical protein